MQRFCHSQKKTEVKAINNHVAHGDKGPQRKGMVVDRGDLGEVAERHSDGGTWR